MATDTGIKELVFEISQGDIDQGVREHASYCPIGLCIVADKRTHSNIEVAVDRKHVKVQLQGQDKPVYFAPMPWEGRDFVVSFDENYSVEPFELPLRIPTWALKPDQTAPLEV